jgi:hypothetical protein
LILQLADGESTDRVATLQLRNLGRTPLRIVGVETSCGCTVVDELPKQPLPSGGAATLKVKVSLPDSGTKVTQLGIDYAASTTGRIVVPLELHGRKPDLPFARLRDAGISLPIADRTRSATRQLSIQTVEPAGEPPWIVGLRPQAPWLTAVLKGEPEMGPSDAGQVARTYHLEIMATLPADAADSEFAEIEFETNSATTKRPPNLRVVTTLTPILKAVPAQLTVLRNASSAEVVERKFAVIAAGAGPWDVTVDAALPLGITIEKLNTNIGDEQTVVVFLAAITPTQLADSSGRPSIHIVARGNADHVLYIPLIVND